jgi:hypothetical protein
MTLPGTASSDWIESSDATDHPPLSEDTDVDVDVVGVASRGSAPPGN